jgi:divalent metal cation (Fe/Co/Zn/Cd) transporter
MSWKTRLISGLVVLLVIFVAAVVIASKALGKDVGAFDFEKTWYIWAIAIFVLGVIECKIFGARKK